MAKDPTKNPEFKRVLGNHLSSPPKPHSEMKIGKATRDSGKAKTMTKKRASKKKAQESA